MNDARMSAVWARRGNFFFVSTNMAGQEITVSMQDHREITLRAESLPTAFFTESERRRTTAIMKN